MHHRQGDAIKAPVNRMFQNRPIRLNQPIGYAQSSLWRRSVAGNRTLLFAALLFTSTLCPRVCRGSEPDQASKSNTFPDVSDVFQGRTFKNEFERDVFFLRSIHDHHRQHWAALLQANITPDEYVRSPAKLLRFVDELGHAMSDRNDLAASTNLALLTSNEAFYANTNAYHPEILRAAAQALIKIGPSGRKALA